MWLAWTHKHSRWSHAEQYIYLTCMYLLSSSREMQLSISLVHMQINVCFTSQCTTVYKVISGKKTIRNIAVSVSVSLSLSLSLSGTLCWLSLSLSCHSLSLCLSLCLALKIDCSVWPLKELWKKKRAYHFFLLFFSFLFIVRVIVSMFSLAQWMHDCVVPSFAPKRVHFFVPLSYMCRFLLSQSCLSPLVASASYVSPESIDLAN